MRRFAEPRTAREPIAQPNVLGNSQGSARGRIREPTALPGFARRDCEALASDGLRSLVRWKGGDHLPLSDRKRVAFRFWLEGKDASPRLYGFRFLSAA